MKRLVFLIPLILLVILPNSLLAQAHLSAEELARKTQDPLANVKAIITDNTIGFGTSGDDTSYNFQIQPVYAIPTKKGYSFIARAIFPIIGAPTTDIGTKWGLSDSILQLFWTPDAKSSIKLGFGPQVSLRTRTTDRVAGPGWGAGLAGVFFGIAGNLSYGAILGHHWGEEGFSLTTIQPIIFYNFEALPGFYVGYNNSITYDWNVPSTNWQLPLGFTAGQTIPLGDAGHALDLNLGAYGLAVKPEGGSDWQLKFSISLFFP